MAHLSRHAPSSHAGLPQSPKGENELVKHGDLGIMASSPLHASSTSSPPSSSLSSFYTFSSFPPVPWMPLHMWKESGRDMHTRTWRRSRYVQGTFMWFGDGDRKGLKWVKGSKRRVNSCIAQGSREAKGPATAEYSIIGASPTSLSTSNFQGASF